MPIRMLRDWRGFVVGEILELGLGVSDVYVRIKVAEWVKEEVAKTPKRKSRAKTVKKKR